MKNYKKYCCPCCGYYTFNEPVEGYYEVCEVCFWQDDLDQKKNPSLEIGANDICLNTALKNYLSIGAVCLEGLKYIRKPLEEEIPEWIIIIDKSDYNIFIKYVDQDELKFLKCNNIFRFDNKENVLLDHRNDADLIIYDLICDLYTKIGIDENDEPTKLGYKIEGISDYIYYCMDKLKDNNRCTIITNYERWELFQERCKHSMK